MTVSQPGPGKIDFDGLAYSLCYLHMTELKEMCRQLHISLAGDKNECIERIVKYVRVEVEASAAPLPAISVAQRNMAYPLDPSTRIVSGGFKNDEPTRLFLQKLIGPHFRFTGFGQQWIKGRWYAGNPPTYHEFAVFWQRGYLAEQEKKASPNKEWAYLNFVKKYHKKNPGAEPQLLAQEWQKYRAGHRQKALDLLNTHLSLGIHVKL